MPTPTELERARAWRTAKLHTICDELTPWEHGTIARASRYPDYYDFNLARVERDAAISVERLIAVAETALGDLGHRRVEVDHVALGERLRPGFKARGWRTDRLLWMRLEAAPPEGADAPIEEVAYDDAHELRVTWLEEDFPGGATSAYFRQAREVAMRLGARVLAVRRAGKAIAFAQLERNGGGVEISEVYVHPDHRGRGLGTALTRAAIRAAGATHDLWISADDEDRPKHLYARLGFRPVWTAWEFTRWL